MDSTGSRSRLFLLFLVLLFGGCQTVERDATFGVYYQANGATEGAIPVDLGKYPTGTTVTVKGNTGKLAKKNMHFSGWNTSADGSGTVYGAGDSLVIAGTTVVLYAQWVADKDSDTI